MDGLGGHNVDSGLWWIVTNRYGMEERKGNPGKFGLFLLTNIREIRVQYFIFLSIFKCGNKDDVCLILSLPGQCSKHYLFFWHFQTAPPSLRYSSRKKTEKFRKEGEEDKKKLVARPEFTTQVFFAVGGKEEEAGQDVTATSIYLEQ